MPPLLTVNVTQVTRLFALRVSELPMVMLPDTVNVLPTISSTVLKVPRVIDLAVAALLIRGRNAPVKLELPMVTSVAAVGTPDVQFADVPQAVLDVPFQLVDCPKEGKALKSRHNRQIIRG